jgi:hypothetical protein
MPTSPTPTYPTDRFVALGDNAILLTLASSDTTSLVNGALLEDLKLERENNLVDVSGREAWEVLASGRLRGTLTAKLRVATGLSLPTQISAKSVVYVTVFHGEGGSSESGTTAVTGLRYTCMVSRDGWNAPSGQAESQDITLRTTGEPTTIS